MVLLFFLIKKMFWKFNESELHVFQNNGFYAKRICLGKDKVT